MVAVAEYVGDQWWRGDGEVPIQGRVSCAEEFNSEAARRQADGSAVRPQDASDASSTDLG